MYLFLAQTHECRESGVETARGSEKILGRKELFHLYRSLMNFGAGFFPHSQRRGPEARPAFSFERREQEDSDAGEAPHITLGCPYRARPRTLRAFHMSSGKGRAPR